MFFEIMQIKKDHQPPMMAVNTKKHLKGRYKLTNYF